MFLKLKIIRFYDGINYSHTLSDVEGRIKNAEDFIKAEMKFVKQK